jgi:hypothetical protein
MPIDSAAFLCSNFEVIALGKVKNMDLGFQADKDNFTSSLNSMSDQTNSVEIWQQRAEGEGEHFSEALLAAD